MKRWKKVLLAVVALSLILGGYVWWQVRSLEVEHLSGDLYVLRGLGGNTVVLRTSVGNVIIDTMTLPMQGSRIRETARQLTGQETVLVINTHYHLDHTHGNPAFEPGTRVLSTERTLAYLKGLDADFWEGDAAQLLPNETFTDRQTLTLGGQTLELIAPGPAHTDGDLVVHLPEKGVLVMGDLVFNGHYPNIDLEAGGTVQNWPQVLDHVLALPFDRAVPGHGPTTDPEGVRQFQRFMQQLGEIGRTAAAEGWTLEETLATDRLTEDAGYTPLRLIIPIGLDREFVLQRAWEEATGNIGQTP